MSGPKIDFLEQLLHSQREYTINSNCTGVITRSNVLRYIITQENQLLVRCPSDISFPDAQRVAELLKGKLKRVKINATFVVPSADTLYRTRSLRTCELALIPGLVKNNEIIMLYPDFGEGTEYQKSYDAVKTAAEILGGRVENIVVRAYYHYKEDDFQD